MNPASASPPESAAWWPAQLAGVPALDLPTDRPRPAIRVYTAAVVTRPADAALRPALAGLAASVGGDEALVGLAGVFAVIHRYTGQTDLLIDHDDGSGALLPIRVAVDPDAGFRALLERTAAALAEARAHGPHASTAELAFRGTAPATAAGARLRHALDLALDPHAGLIAAHAVELHDGDTAARLLAHWQVVLVAAAADPETPLARLPLLPEDERRTVVDAWNTTAVPVAPGLCVHHQFADQAARTPDAPAVWAAGETLTYGELAARAAHLAAALRGLGVGPDVLVGLHLERSLDLAVAVVAILLSGGAYVPLDPAYPQPRIAWILEDTAAPVIVTTAALADSLPPHAARLVLVDRPADAPHTTPPDPHPSRPGDLAYVIYTSGSTGRPKGIGLPHAALVNLVEWHARTLLPGARTLQFASIGFDASFHEMFAAWRTGGVVYLIPEVVRRDVALLARFIGEHAIEKVILPVVVLQQLAQEFGDRPGVLASLREVTTTGEQMHITAPVIDLFKTAALRGCPLHNHYGPSESHVVTAYTLPPEPDRWPPHPPIGRPIDNTKILILDAAMNPCPIGVPGELYIGGVCLARGYWNRPDLTAERFVRDPLSADPEARLYRSGDVARTRADGTIEYLGRRDDQVKIRGVRVELGEVEAAISRHPSVQECVVLAREDAPGERRLVAYVVHRPLHAPVDLRAFVGAALPEVMVPAVVVPLRGLPLTTHGKVDKRGLPAPESAPQARAGAFVAPRSEIEAALASIWQEVLRVDRVGVHDDFFAHGGHSLSATQVFSRVRRLFGVEVSLQQLFTHPTIAALAAWIKAERAPASATAPLVAVPRAEATPLSLAQERLWFLHRLAPASTAYSCPYFFRLLGPLDLAALQRALEGLVARHEALRTTFREHDGRPLQVVAARGDATLERADLRDLPPGERGLQLRQRLGAEVLRTFDLERGPLVRAGVVRLADAESVLWLNIHHIVVDGWSMDVVLRELAALYEAARRGTAVDLPPLALQFADYAAWQRDRLRAADIDAMVAWWKAALTGAPALLALPTDRPRPPIQSFRGGAVRVHLDPARTAALRELGVRRGLTTTMVLLAGYVALLHRYTGETDIVVGIPIAARDRVEIEPLVGLFVNTLPVRVDVSGDPTFDELLARVRVACLAAYDRDVVPFDRIVQELRPERTLAYSPIVQVGFAPQPAGERDLQLEGLEVHHLDIDAQKTIFDLTLYTWEERGGVSGSLEFSVDLFDRSTIERMRGHLIALWRGAAADPARQISRVPLLSAGERDNLLRRWNATDAATPAGTMHGLFDRWVAADPEHPAVALGDQRLSYAALGRRADRLAHTLRARGVGPEDRVAISVDRSFDLIVAVLGVLKAGAAFVPLDPAYPHERLAFMLADSGAAVVLTQRRLAAQFADHPAIVCLDDDAALARAGAAPLPAVAADGLAYVIYTSGSTGTPKGVMIEHRGAVNLAHAHGGLIDLDRDSVVLQFASPSFDAFVWELLMTWAAGATLCLIPPGLAIPGREFAELLRRHAVTLALFPPSLLAALPFEPFPALTHVIAGGEACSAELVARWGPGRRFLNAYGPTEITVCATMARCEPARGAPPIGAPLANVRVHVLDVHGDLVPVGVPGELWIGGVGVARGYLGRPALTAERFVPDRFSARDGDRLYRSGDRVRWRADGQLEYLGRLDDQVKLRGFRVELGEVEAALRSQVVVQDVAVVARPDLVAYVVAGADAASTTEREQQIDAWRTLYDDTYARTSAGGPQFNTTGWISSFTGLPIPGDVMRAWRDATVDRIAALAPTRVWEIGCGTGLLLLPLAPRCAAYHGTDLSPRAVEDLGRQIADLGLRHVTVEHRVADDVHGLESARFDLVILNSVVQYFPDPAYLQTVLAGAAERVDTGAVFVGDVRCLALLEAFHTAIQLAQAPGDAPVARVRERVLRAVRGENELALDGPFFAALRARVPRLAHVEVWLKRGAGVDEMTRFRHDVVLFLGAAPPPIVVDATWPWGQIEIDLAGLEQRLVAAGHAALEILDVPNARVAAAVAAATLLAGARGTARELAADAAVRAAGAVDPEALWLLGERLGLAVRVTPARSGDPAAIDVLFERVAAGAPPRAWARAAPPHDERRSVHANDPLRARLQRQLGPSLRAHLQARLPAYMVPSAVVLVDALPRSPNGKVDRRALAEPAFSPIVESSAYVHPRSEVEHTLAEIWREVLGVDRVGIDDAFFELGGHSLLLAQVRSAIVLRLGREPMMVDLFQHPTIRTLAAHLTPATDAAKPAPIVTPAPTVDPGAIAIVGLAGRFPGAATVDALWVNLMAGVEGITAATHAELLAAGVDPELVDSPQFVPAFGQLDHAFAFDAAFFGYSPHEARLLDPQQRVFLECAFAAVEDAGLDPARTAARVGVFGGCDGPRYWLRRVGLPGGPLGIEELQAALANVPDNLTTRVAYKLGLRGPAVTVLSACSTSLVAVHTACVSLRGGECDVALAGGVAVAPPGQLGHVHSEGGILSPDGHCRPFDASAAGTVSASAVAIVVLKRLVDALRDRDTIRAVIRGSAIGNDGADKIGFTAPGVRGQAETIARAHAAAGVEPDSIGFVEAHGTATALGDPIEVTALTQAFRARSERRSFCALGSLKSNLGHTGAAAGVTGLIKATLALQHRWIPPTLHFRRPSPALRLEDSPFFVNAEPLAWSAEGPRRAGVSAFGVGGTNAHVVLEEAPPLAASGPSRRWQILPLSARADDALATRAEQLAAHLDEHPDVPLADVAFTLQQRPALAPARRVVVARGRDEALAALTGRTSAGVAGTSRARQPKLVFVFPGGGAQQVGMARELHAHEPVFRAAFDECAGHFTAAFGDDLHDMLFPSDAESAASRPMIPSRLMASIYAVEVALARLLIAWGLAPAAMIGHSLGEYAAAVIADVMSLADAAALLIARGRVYDELPDAAMLSVPLPEALVAPRLGPQLSLAAVNAADTCVVAGPQADIDRLVAELARDGVEARLLAVNRAGHSSLVDPALPWFVDRARAATLRTPTIPMVTCVDGGWLGEAARDPAHWGRHLRGTVRFHDAVATLLADPDHVFIEVGPGAQLSGLIRRHPAATAARVAVSAMAHPRSGRGEIEALLLAVGQLWCLGAALDWDAFAAGEQRRRVPLPTYPFARTVHLMGALPEPRHAAAAPPTREPAAPSALDESTSSDPFTRTLAEIWRALLGVADVRADDNFFDLGGSSIVAIQLRARLLDRLGVTAPMHALIEHPTLAGLAEFLRERAAADAPAPSAPATAAPSLLVKLRAGSPAVRPLFLVQPIGGTVFTYLPLARRLAHAGPIHGVRASGMDPGEPVLEDIHAIAGRYVDELQRVQAAGPYLIGGHSAGGVIAWEMAQQLAARGQTSTLLMIDVPSLSSVRLQAIKSADDVLRELAVFESTTSAAYQGLVVALTEGSSLGAIMLATWRALHRYEPRPTRSDVVFLSAAEQRDPRDTHAGTYWMDRAQAGFSLHRCPGDHFTMMDEPQVQHLARALAPHLAAPAPPTSAMIKTVA